jgi:hypothetical protein
MARNMLLIAEKHYRGPRAILSQFKEIYWSLAYLSLKGGVSMRAWNFLLWLISRDAFAAAARLGIRDYLLRRFGRISNSAAQKMSDDEIVRGLLAGGRQQDVAVKALYDRYAARMVSSAAGSAGIAGAGRLSVALAALSKASCSRSRGLVVASRYSVLLATI